MTKSPTFSLSDCINPSDKSFEMKPIKLLVLFLGLSLQVVAQEDFHSPPGEVDLLGVETTLKLNDAVETILQHQSRYRGQFHLNSEQSDQMLQIACYKTPGTKSVEL